MSWRPRRALVVLSLAFAGCGLEIVGVAELPTSGPADRVVPDSSARVDGGLVDAPAETGAEPVDASSDAEAISCADVLARDPKLRAQNGQYEVDPDGPKGKPALVVFCDMTTDDGGWTLVGRSYGGGAQFFGWTSSSGSLDDSVYSLDVRDAGLGFSEVMVADRAPYEYVPATLAFKFAVPKDFVAKYANAATPIQPTTILGDCDVAGGPSFLQSAGYTSLTRLFFFGSSLDPADSTGLGPSAFAVAGPSCPSGASLNQRAGLVFVR